MNIEDVRDYCLLKNGVTEELPFGPTALVFKVGGKMFLLAGLDSEPLTISVKTDPAWSEELREQHAQITGAFHMNKKHWNSVLCEGVPRKLIIELIDHSYDLVLFSLRKDLREAILNAG